MPDKYVAYVSTYTMGSLTNDRKSYGIKIYDVDLEQGYLHEKGQVEITNSSYTSISHNNKFLFSITDLGVKSYKIEKDGLLTFINEGFINGMRGCYLSTDYEDRFLFVSGYHDGKITVLRVTEDGRVGEITDEIFCKGLGSVAERNFRPHASCVKMTRDNRYLCVADLGMDHVNVYELNHTTGKLKLVDVLRSDLESAPRHLKFSQDGRFLYVVHELKCYIDVYSYRVEHDLPEFEKIQTISTLKEYHSINSSACTLNFSEDFHYMLTSNEGDNTVTVYEIDKETGLLKMLLCLPVSGDYPKDVELFPDNKHLVSLNHESNTMTFFKTDLEKGLLMMCAKELHVNAPNCLIFHKLPAENEG